MKLNGVEVPKKKRKNIFLRIALLAAAVYAIVSLIQGQLQLEQKLQELDEMIALNEQGAAVKEQLQEMVDNSDSYLEEQAREQGMVLPGESVFIEIPNNH